MNTTAKQSRPTVGTVKLSGLDILGDKSKHLVHECRQASDYRRIKSERLKELK